MLGIIDINDRARTANTLLEVMEKMGITTGEVMEESSFKGLFNSIFSGDSVLLIDGCNKCIAIGTKGWQDRGIGYPVNEPNNNGPQEAFNETLRTNTSLIRRKIKHENLRIESVVVGKFTKTEVNVVYIKGTASDDIVKEVKSRLNKIKMEGIMDSAYIERAIDDKHMKTFPTILSTERPDYLSVKLLEGRVGIIVDGSPFVLFVPVFFSDIFKSTSDYYSNAGVQYFMIGLRYISLLIGVFLTSVYIALISFHPVIIPTSLQVNIIAEYSLIVLPLPLEIIILLLFFEILKEASFRLPVLTSVAILLVGGLIISQSIVEAKLGSNVIIIIVGLTIVASYTFVKPCISNAIRNFRIAFVLLSSFLGLYGIAIGVLFIVGHISGLTSMGTTYLSNKYKSHGTQ